MNANLSVYMRARWLAAGTALVLAVSSIAGFAAEPPPASAPTKQMREQMASLHEKMAVCLRSDKDIAACRTEMQQNCKATMGEQGCPMMGMHGPGRMKHDRMRAPVDDAK